MSDKTNETASPATPPAAATAESILAFRNRPPIETCDLPDGRRVYIHGLTDIEFQGWQDSCGRKRDEQGVERLDDAMGDAKLLVRCLRDAEGKRLFTDAHLPQLIELPNAIKAPLIRKALKVCGIGRDADAEILKNYGAPAGGS